MILTDSIAKYVVIRGCETIPYRGANIKDMTEEIRKNEEIEGYENIIIHVGTNNLEQSILKTMSDYMGLIEVVTRRNQSAKIIMSNILPRPRDNVLYGKKIVMINKEMKKYSRERGIKSTQTDKIFRRAYEPKRELYAEDGLHLNFEGTRKLENYFKEVLMHQGKK